MDDIIIVFSASSAKGTPVVNWITCIHQTEVEQFATILVFDGISNYICCAILPRCFFKTSLQLRSQWLQYVSIRPCFAGSNSQGVQDYIDLIWLDVEQCHIPEASLRNF